MRLHLHEWGDRGAPPVVCLHGVSAHGRRFRRLAEERLARRFRVLAPDLRGHGYSDWDPPWSIATHVDDVLETLVDGGRGAARRGSGTASAAVWFSSSARSHPERVERAALLDPAIQLLPHVGLDFAEETAHDQRFDTPEDAIEARLQTARRLRASSSRRRRASTSSGSRTGSAGATAARQSSRPTASSAPNRRRRRSCRTPTLLVHASEFGLVREEQLDEYASGARRRLEVVEVPGGHIVYWDAVRGDRRRDREVPNRDRAVSHA